jgi:hypothetical protein
LRRQRRSGESGAQKLGILAFRASAEELTSIRALSRVFLDLRPDLGLVVIGSSIDDLELIQVGNTFVTGSVAPDELDRLLDQYGIGALLVGLGRPLFGHPLEQAAVKSALPIARFDWSLGKYRAQTPDLAVNPQTDPADIARLLLRWLGKR